MLISATSAASAPHSTGHPLGLPAFARQPVRDTQVAAARAASDSALGQGGDRPFVPVYPRQLPAEGEARTAPPSIMQIRISSLLLEQAAAHAEKAAADLPEPAPVIQTTGAEATAAPLQAAEPNVTPEDKPTPARTGYEDARTTVALRLPGTADA